MSNPQSTLPPIGTALPALGGTLGAFVAYPGGITRALIVASAEHELKSEWGAFGVDVPGARGISGMASTEAMAAARCEVAKAVRALNIDGHADWFIGGPLEMAALNAYAPELLAKAPYWTSSQYSAHGAWAQDFEYGNSIDFSKYYAFRVRPLRCIQLQELLAFWTSSGEAGATDQAATEAPAASEA